MTIKPFTKSYLEPYVLILDSVLQGNSYCQVNTVSRTENLTKTRYKLRTEVVNDRHTETIT